MLSNATRLLQLLVFLHILCAIVGFGSTFVWAMLGSKAKEFDPKSGYQYSQLIAHASERLTTPFIIATGVIGFALVALGSDYGVKFSQTWVSIAMFLFFVGLGVSFGLLQPNQKAMLAIQKKLAEGDVTPTPGGPPAEVAELGERGQKAAMYGGILHVLFLLMMLDMVFKPGM